MFIRTPVPANRVRGAYSENPGEELGTPPPEVVHAYELRAELVNLGTEPERIKVFYVVDGEAERRFSLEAFDRFLSDESYESIVEALQEEGEFWLGIAGPDGDLELPIERVA
jgi:hypothetical protein